MTIHRMTDRREPFLNGGWAFAFAFAFALAFAFASGFSVTFQNNRLGRIYIVRAMSAASFSVDARG